jgi:hypothetical protein
LPEPPLSEDFVSSLPSSPTPKNVATAYARLLGGLTRNDAGRDGRVGPGEARKNELVADAYRLTGAKRPTVDSVIAHGYRAMHTEANAVHGGDSRVSRADGARMSPLYAKAFEMMRAQGKTPSLSGAELGQKIGQLAQGIQYMSESDYPYSMVVIPNVTSLDEATVKRAFNAELTAVLNAGETLAQLKMAIQPDNNHFFDESKRDDGYHSADEMKRLGKIHDLLKQHLADTTASDSSGAVKTAKLWAITPTDAVVNAPYWFVGLTPDGSLVGLRTDRVWT